MVNNQAEMLSGLAAVDAEAVAGLGLPVRLAPGQVLFDLGDSADCVYLIRRGRIALTLPMSIGGRHQDVFIEERLPGQTCGWSALIPPWRFTLKASSPLETELTSISRASLLDYCAQKPHVGYVVALNVAAVIGQRLQVVQAMWLREMQRLVNDHA
jgi:CRP-like cAMP-binding protein